MKNHLIILIFLNCLYACQRLPDSQKNQVQDTSKRKEVSHVQKVITKPLISNDTITVISFNELSVVIDGLGVYDRENKLDQVQKDTVFLYEGFGASMKEEKHIFVNTTSLTQVNIEQCYETSVSVSDEGPHCDMIEWKHYTSKWRLLKKKDENGYIIYPFTEEEESKFPKVTEEDLKTAIDEHCGDRMVNLLQNKIGPNEYPCHVGISRMFYKITGTSKENGKLITKYIIIEVPMGC